MTRPRSGIFGQALTEMKDKLKMVSKLFALVLIAVGGWELPGFAVTLSLSSTPPNPGPYDIYNLAGADMDMNNVFLSGNAPATNGAANDGYTYVANDRVTQGQTFTTGSGDGGYLLTGIWVRHAGYIDNTEDPNTANSNGTWWQMAGGGNLTLRVTRPSQAGNSGFVLSSETYPATGAEGWPTSVANSLNGDGMWLHFKLATPLLLATNTTYGFDLTSVGNNNAFFEWLGNGTNVFGGGTAYQGGAAGVPDDTLTTLVGDRVFLLQLTPQAHPKLTAQLVSGNHVELSWLSANAGYLLQSTTNLAGPWTYSGLAVTNWNGTNFSADGAADGERFYRLQYANPNDVRMIPVVSWQTNGDGLTFQMDPGTLRLQVFSPRVVRVAYSLSNAVPSNSFAVIESSTNSGWNVASSASEVALTTSELQVRVSRATGAVGFYDTNGVEILAEPPLGGKSLEPATVSGFNTLQSRQQFVISPDEAIYGLGEHASGLMNYRGASVHLQNKNPSEGSTPVLVSSRGYGLFWDNPAISDVSVAQDSPTNLVLTSEAADSVDYYFMYGPKPDDVVAGYRNLTGNAPLFGKWAWGLWQCKNHYQTQSEVLGVAGTYRADNIPLDGVIQDWQYWTPNPWGSHHFDTSRYPDVAQMMQTLHDENAHLIISVWARFDTNIYNANALAAVNGLYTNVLANVYPAGYGQWYDPFNPEARQVYWDEIATNLFNLGIDGWWFDASEPELSGNWGEFRSYHTAAGPGARVFNAYPLMHTTSAYEGQRATDPNKRVFILTRSAWAGQQRNAAVTWSGDINGNFTVLAQQIAAGLNFSISGIPYWNTDTGGFNDGSPTDPAYDELFTRWFQFSTFCPMLRIHGNNDKAIYNFPSSTQTILIDYDNLRYHLIPYIYSVSWMVAHDGYTMMRPLMMDFQQDTKVFNIPDQYTFGPALMACPVTTSGATNRSVYLPLGTTWYDFWTGETNAGGQTITASAPIQTMPLYVRAGTILPYGPAIQYAMQTNNPIELRIYRGADGNFTLYEDEGDNYDYESGSYSTIPFTWDESTQTLTIGARQGSFPGMLTNRTFRIVWVSSGHGAGIPVTTTVDRLVSYSGNAVEVQP
jgi:alpha-D-xyloside xylohydrolase